MSKCSVGGSTGARILGEAVTNLDQHNCTCELEDTLRVGVRHDGGVELEVTYDDAVGVNEKITFLV